MATVEELTQGLYSRQIPISDLTQQGFDITGTGEWTHGLLPVYVTNPYTFYPTNLFGGGSNPTEKPYLDEISREYVTANLFTTMTIQVMGCTAYPSNENYSSWHIFPQNKVSQQAGWSLNWEKRIADLLSNPDKNKMFTVVEQVGDLGGNGLYGAGYRKYLYVRKSDKFNDDVFYGHFKNFTPKDLCDGIDPNLVQQGLFEGLSNPDFPPLPNKIYTAGKDLKYVLGQQTSIKNQKTGVLYYLRFFRPENKLENWAQALYLELAWKYSDMTVNTDPNTHFMYGYIPRYFEPIDVVFTSQLPSCEVWTQEGRAEGEGSNSVGTLVVARIWFGVTANLAPPIANPSKEDKT